MTRRLMFAIVYREIIDNVIKLYEAPAEGPRPIHRNHLLSSPL